MKRRNVLYVFCIIILFGLLSFSPWGREVDPFLASRISSRTGIPNAVSAIYLQDRLYDTLFEVFVFSVSLTGALFFLGGERSYAIDKKIHADAPMILILRGSAYFSMIFGCALILAGHLSPGGGFAAGVALGTSLVIQSILPEKDSLVRYLSNYDLVKTEKVAWLAILIISAFVCGGLLLPRGFYGSLLSGGWIPVLNLFIGIKVGLGAWALVIGFLVHRWIF